MEFKQRVTGCIADRFKGLFDNENNGATEEQRELYAHNCTLALDIIGAGKVAQGQAMELIKRVIAFDFETEDELLDYIAKVRAPRKPKEWTEETKQKRDILMLAKGNRFTTEQIARCLGISESVVIETIKEKESK